MFQIGLKERFTKKNCKKQTIKNLELNSKKRNNRKAYVKWKAYNSSFYG